MKKALIIALTLILCLSLLPAAALAEGSSVPLAYPHEGKVILDGREFTLKMYQLRGKDGTEAGTNYVRVRDLAVILNGSKYQFDVGYKSGKVLLLKQTAYTGRIETAPFTKNEPYDVYTTPALVDGVETTFDAFQLHDSAGGGYTYYKLRELGSALGFSVSNKGSTPVITSGVVTVDRDPYGEMFYDRVDLASYDNPNYSISVKNGAATVKVCRAEPWTDYCDPNSDYPEERAEALMRQKVYDALKKTRKIPLENVTKVYELPNNTWFPGLYPYAILGTSDGRWYYADLVGAGSEGAPTVELLDKAVGVITSFSFRTTSHVEYDSYGEIFAVGEDVIVAVMANGSEIAVK